MLINPSLVKSIELAERKVLAAQRRIIEQNKEVTFLLQRLESEANNLKDIKKEWIEKKNDEIQRSKIDLNELKRAHRITINELKLKYDQEREDRLRDVKMKINELEKKLREEKAKLEHEAGISREGEQEIRARHQVKLNAVLRNEQSASRRGVVKQKRFLDQPNIFTTGTERQTMKMRKCKNSYNQL